MTLVPSLEEKDQLNAGVLHLLFALALAKQGGLGGILRSWQGSLLHSMKCKWGPITKHVGVSLVCLSAECVSVCVHGGGRQRRKWGPLDGGTPLPPDTMLQREGSGPLGPVPVAAADAYPKNQSFCRGCGKLPK